MPLYTKDRAATLPTHGYSRAPAYENLDFLFGFFARNTPPARLRGATAQVAGWRGADPIRPADASLS